MTADNSEVFSLYYTEDSHKGEEPLLIIPFTAAAVVAVVGLLATVGIVAIIRYNRNTGEFNPISYNIIIYIYTHTQNLQLNLCGQLLIGLIV